MKWILNKNLNLPEKKQTNKQNQLHVLLLNKSHFQTNFTSPPFRVS